MRLHDLPSLTHAPVRCLALAALLSLLTAGFTACSGSNAPTDPARDPNAGSLTGKPLVSPAPAPLLGGTPGTTSIDGTPVSSFGLVIPVSSTMPTADDFAAGRILVRFAPSADADAIHARLGGTFDKFIEGMDVQIVTVPAGQELALIAAYNREAGVDYAEPDHKYAAFFTPNDTSFASKQWDMTKMNCQGAWDVTKGLASIKVAVLDTGLDTGHTDVGPKMVASKNFSSTSTSVQDAHGHGTHCAGTVAAATNNSKGVAGVGFNTSLMVGKVLADNGSGYTSWIASGINWAYQNGAKVISMSLGGGGGSSTMQSAVNAAWNAGCVVVAAAGNSNTSTMSYPAAYTNCIAVAATTSSDKRASYSNYGTWVDVAAPGSSIYSTYKRSGTTDAYATMSGTSMACPHVAGLAALVWASPYGTSASAVRARIESTGDTITTDKPIGKRVNAARAVGAIP
ncbi:MAG: hypothetical protein GEEBNDBF_02484 [bacterium]|nr:hypothetical protein [bacterium]